MDELERGEALDFDALQEQRSDELTELLDSRQMRKLKERMEELNEFGSPCTKSPCSTKRKATTVRSPLHHNYRVAPAHHS